LDECSMSLTIEVVAFTGEASRAWRQVLLAGL
jgi:hypothetical protein